MNQITSLLAKRIFIIPFFWILISCTESDHSHDGTYEGPMSTWVIDGNDLTVYMFNFETKSRIKFEGSTAYIESGNLRQVYQIEYDKDSTKMFVAGSGLAKIEMKKVLKNQNGD